MMTYSYVETVTNAPGSEYEISVDAALAQCAGRPIRALFGHEAAQMGLQTLNGVVGEAFFTEARRRRAVEREILAAR